MISQEKPSVSVFVPVFDGAEFLDRTIDSLQAQELADWEAVFVDDCSTDDSLAVLQRRAESDHRIRVISTEVNLGSAARVLRRFAGCATGSHFAYSSQDDLFSKDWLSSMLKRSRETGADAILPRLCYYLGENEFDEAEIPVDRGSIISGRQAVELSLDWSIPGCALWPTALVRRVGFEDFAMNADEFSVRMLFHSCDELAFADGVYFYNQTNPNAITKLTHHPRMVGTALTQARLAQFLLRNGYPRTLVAERYLQGCRDLLRKSILLPLRLPMEERTAVRDALDALSEPHVRQLARESASSRRDRHAVRATTHGPVVFRLAFLLARFRDRWKRRSKA